MADDIDRENEIYGRCCRTFGDDFIADLDSWFSADIACCDNCYDDFLQYWPLAYDDNNSEFQRCCIDLDSFYYGSKRLQHNYTKEEYDVMKHTVNCSRCGSNLQAYMWPYEFPFSFGTDILDFECKMEEIVEISRVTPFLLLENTFAKEVYNTLHSVANKTERQVVDYPLYRARISTQVERISFEEFRVAPKENIAEGRYNHAGDQVMYTASDMKTCFYEVNKKLCYVSECYVEKELRILNLQNTCGPTSEQEDMLNALIFSALMSKKISTEGYHRPAYIFSRFIADCAKSAKFDAIKYPSTKVTKDNFNLAIINEDIFHNHIKFKSICFYDGSFHVELPPLEMLD